MNNGLNRTYTGKEVESDLARCRRTAKDTLKFIMANKEALLRHRNGEGLLQAAISISQHDELTPKQISYIDVIYEKTMSALVFESFSATFKPRRRGAGL